MSIGMGMSIYPLPLVGMEMRQKFDTHWV